MENVLITGGAGFIGSNFIRFIITQNPDVHIVNLDKLTYAGSLENVKDLPETTKHTFVHGDICDRELVLSLFKKHRIDTVVHFAAETHVDRSILGPEVFIQTNSIGTFTLLEVARKSWIEDATHPLENVRFHHVSTDEVYGALQPEDPDFSETTPYAPNSPYAASKAASDHFVRAYFHTFGLPITITNCSNNYGPYQFPEKLLPLMALNAMQGKPLPIYGDGQQIRDWLYVVDHCQAIFEVIKQGRLGETYVVGGNNQPTNLMVVKTICEILDEIMPESPYIPHSSLIKFVEDRPGHDRRYAMDIQKIQNELGWSPMFSLEEGLLQTIEWYLNHPEWVSAMQQKEDYRNWMKQNYGNREGAKT